MAHVRHRPALAYAAVGNLLPDFPLIDKSFELCYASSICWRDAMRCSEAPCAS
jgi:Ni,Fe-hydrogenase III large subunit